MCDCANYSKRFRFKFHEDVDMTQVEELVSLARQATAVLCGDAMVRLYGVHLISKHHRVVVMDVASTVGTLITVLFTGFCQKELGASRFAVHHIRDRRKAKT